jgi:hypothetical protein
MEIWKKLQKDKMFQNAFPTYMQNSIEFRSFKIPRIQNQTNLTQFGSLNFNSNSDLNFEKLL